MALLAPMLWKVAKTDEIGGVRPHLVHPEASHQEVLDGVVHIARAAVAKAEGRTNG